MDSFAFQRRIEDVKRRAHGRWTPILKGLGVNETILSGRNQPCPLPGCGGTDRFQYTDKFGEGNYHCRSCGPGGGLKLAQGICGWRFVEMLERIESQVGIAGASVPVALNGPSLERMKRLCQRIWNEAKPIVTGDEADRYLRNRGLALETYPRTLRCHPALGYYERQPGQQRSKKVGEFSALVACVQGPDGHAVTLHRTYVNDGRKALADQSKKVLSSGINGAAVRLDEPADELAITEGIETGLAIRLGTGKAVWAALSCSNLEKLWLPDSVERVCLYADNDADSEFAGQVCAYTLAQRLIKEARKRKLERSVQVFVPKNRGTDWADIWFARLANEKKTA